MAIRPILQVPDPRLRMICAPATIGDPVVRRVGTDLLDTMRKYHAMGLAAPQIGEMVRVVAINQRSGFPFSVLINPEIMARAGAKVLDDEGCMSIDMGRPETRFPVKRHERIRVRFVDRADQVHEVWAEGLAARAIQHEVDHLDGILVDGKARVAA